MTPRRTREAPATHAGGAAPLGSPQRATRASTDEPRQRPPAGARRCHDALDAAVAAADGWSADISDDEALRGWLALNSGARGSLGH